jgi:hypothetical protein
VISPPKQNESFESFVERERARSSKLLGKGRIKKKSWIDF